MSNLELFIFDLDGTLVDSRQDLTDAVNHTLEYFAIPELPMERVLRYVGHGIEKLIESVIQGPEPPHADEALPIFLEYYSSHLLDHTVLYSGMHEVLKALQSQRMAVVTNKHEQFAEIILVGLGIRDYFSLVLGGDVVREKKPSPQPLIEVQRRLGCRKEAAVMIGDSSSDVAAGRKAGMATCWVRWGFKTADDLDGVVPDYVADKPEDLVRFFGAGSKRG